MKHWLFIATGASSYFTPILTFLGGVILTSFTNWLKNKNDIKVKYEAILTLIISVATDLHKANDYRRKRERLLHAFSGQTTSSEAAQRISEFMEKYEALSKSAETDFDKLLKQFHGSSFHFSEEMAEKMNAQIKSLSKFGSLVNEGRYDEADSEFVQFGKNHKELVKLARGRKFPRWRKIFNRKQNQELEIEGEFEIDEKRMQVIMDKVSKWGGSQSHNACTIHPPEKLIRNPDVINSDHVVSELQDSIFTLVFQDGDCVMFTLTELIIWTYLCINLTQNRIEAEKMAKAIADENPAQKTFELTNQFSVPQIMKPKNVSRLLRKVEFSDIPSDAPNRSHTPGES